MDAQTDILKRGLEQAGLAVLDASALANLHLGPKVIGRGVAQRISGRLKLLPARRVIEGDFPDISRTISGPVSPHRLMARIAALRRVIADPDGHAIRLARNLKRLQQKGEPRPMVGAATSAFRLSPELGAIATLLPAQIRAGLDSWESSG